MRRSVTWLGLALLTGACASPSAPVARDVTLTPAATVYAPGALISGMLVNDSEVGYTYGACTVRLERLVGPHWIVASEDPRLCIGSLTVLAARSTNTVTFPLASGLATGTYRLRLELFAGTDRPSLAVRSRHFLIEPPD